MASRFPFGYLSKIELHDLYGLDFPSQLQLLPSYVLRSKPSHIPTLDNFDIDESDVQSISSKYFEISDFSKSNFSFSKQFSLFHVNTRSLAENFDELSAALSALGISLGDVLGITETKQQIRKEFISNVNIDNCLMYTQPSKSSAGGVAIYINNKFDHVKRDDLSMLHDDFESVGVEIKKTKKEKISCVDVCIVTPILMLKTFWATLNQHSQNLTRISIMSSSWVILILIYYSMNLTVIPMTL